MGVPKFVSYEHLYWPPDYFDKNGQNWGFPTYNWEEISNDNYAWWRARLTQVLAITKSDCVCTS